MYVRSVGVGHGGAVLVGHTFPDRSDGDFWVGCDHRVDVPVAIQCGGFAAEFLALRRIAGGERSEDMPRPT